METVSKSEESDGLGSSEGIEVVGEDVASGAATVSCHKMEAASGPEESDGLGASEAIEDEGEVVTFFSVIRRIIAMALVPDSEHEVASSSPWQRFKVSLFENWPLLRYAVANSGDEVLRWTYGGGPMRKLLVISIGTITLVALMALFVFMLFFLMASFVAIIISFLVSLAAVGGFMALFFSCVTAVYIGALSVTAFTISTTLIFTFVAISFATGWIGFLWLVWIITKRGVIMAKCSLRAMESSIFASSHPRVVDDHKTS